MRPNRITLHALERFIERAPQRFTPPQAHNMLCIWMARGRVLTLDQALERGITISDRSQGISVLVAGNHRLGWFAWPVSGNGALLTTLNWKARRPRPKPNAKRFKHHRDDRWL